MIDEINGCSEQIKADFSELIDHLVMNPRDPRLFVLPQVDLSWPGEGYTAPFGLGDDLLFYTLSPDIPTIHLELLIWRASEVW